jgi:hypothetical protein
LSICDRQVVMAENGVAQVQTVERRTEE